MKGMHFGSIGIVMNTNFHLGSSVKLSKDSCSHCLDGKSEAISYSDDSTAYDAIISHQNELSRTERVLGVLPVKRNNCWNIASYVNLIIDSKHRLLIHDDDGNSISPEQEWRIRQNYQDQMLSMLYSRCDEFNALLRQLLTLHFNTPSPENILASSVFFEPLVTAAPGKPTFQTIGLLDKFFPWRERAIDKKNTISAGIFFSKKRDWQQRADMHEQKYQHFWNNRFLDVTNAKSFLRKVLQLFLSVDHMDIQLSLNNNLDTLKVDVKFPEITYIPNIEYIVTEKEYRLLGKVLSPSRKRQYYIQQVHGIGFRIIGEMFRAMPCLVNIVLSGSTKRLNLVTSHLQDDYLYSLKVKRVQWQEIDFSSLATLSLSEVMAEFTLRRNMCKMGIFKAIKPFSESSDSKKLHPRTIISSDMLG